MAWRLHLTNQAIQRIDILPNRPALLVAWTRRDRVGYYDLETGALLGEKTLPTLNGNDRRSDQWQEFVGGLIAPNHTYLPVFRTADLTAYTTDDGRMRLYHTGDTELYVESDGKEVKLHASDAAPFVSIAFDRFLGVTAALDEKGKLHVYQQNIRVGHFDLDLPIYPELPAVVAISRGGGMIFVSNGQNIVVTNTNGKTRGTLDTHYFIGKMTCSPTGRLLATSDLETGVLRVYNGYDLLPTHQKFAIDLVADAIQVQLLADLPPLMVALSAMAIDDNETLAFAMSGVICVTELAAMDELPRPQPLF